MVETEAHDENSVVVPHSNGKPRPRAGGLRRLFEGRDQFRMSTGCRCCGGGMSTLWSNVSAFLAIALTELAGLAGG
jgi:hypothetical protein